MAASETRVARHAPVRLADWRHLRTTDGGARGGDADLWASYAAVRALRWLGARPGDPEAVASFLAAHHNADGGCAWQRGLRCRVAASRDAAFCRGLAGVVADALVPPVAAEYLFVAVDPVDPERHFHGPALAGAAAGEGRR